MRNVWIGILTVMMLLMACVDEVNDNSQSKVPDKLVLHAFIHPDSQLYVRLAMVSGVNEPDIWVNDASVFYEDSKGIKTAFKGNNVGEYRLNNPLNPNDSVRIRIIHAKFNGLLSSKIPNKLVIQKVDTFTTLVSGLGKTKGYRIYFKDSAYLQNFYQISIWRVYWNYNSTLTDSQLLKEKINIGGNEFAFLRNQYNQYATKEILFSDEIINGVNNHLEVYETVPRVKIASQKTLYYLIELDNINEGYFDYINSRNAHIWQQNSITQLPMQISGNISATYGVFGLYTNQAVKISP